MDIAIDASSLINFSNANALELVVQLSHWQFHVSPLVANECHPRCIAEVTRLQRQNNMHLVQTTQINAELYLNLLNDHSLGEGETECIAVCLTRSCHLCCDDKRARSVASSLIGKDRVIGSIGLLKQTVGCGLISANSAYDIYRMMRDAGGFLPALQPSWFK